MRLVTFEKKMEGGGSVEEEESRRALAQVEHERKHGGPGQEPATDPNAKVLWMESVKAEKAELSSAASRAADKAEEAALRASGSKQIAENVRCMVDEAFAEGRSAQKLDTEDKRFAGAVRSESGLDTLQGMNDKALEEELRVPVLRARDELGAPSETTGISTKDTNYS